MIKTTKLATYTCAIAALCCTPVALADTVLGVYAGVQGWDMEVEGGFANSESLTNFGFDSETRQSVYVALEHPVPLLPNVKIQNTTMDTAGSAVLNANFTFGGELFNTQTTALTNIDLTSTDFILYYEIFDNDLVSLDLGINGKDIDGEILVTSQEQPDLRARESFSGIVPMAYGKVAFGLPTTGWSLYAEGSLLSIDDDKVQDYQVALAYEFVDTLAVDMHLQLGYRSVSVELDDLDDVYTDIEFSGAFLGLQMHF